MSYDEFKMSTGQAHEFALACARNGLSLDDVKYLSGGKRLARAMAHLRGDPETVARPFSFSKNEHGHDIVEVTGLSLTGAEEIARLEAVGFRVGDYAKSMLLSTNPDSYDANHRLEDGRVYKVAIVPGREVKRNRTTVNLQTYGQSFGYGKPLAGIQPRIREAVSDEQLKEMGIDYIASLHDPIKDSDGGSGVLDSSRDVVGRWLCSCCA